MQPSVRKKSWMNRFIDTIEYWGNKLPHPFILFGMLVVITLIVLDLIPGWLQHNLYGSFTNPRGTGKGSDHCRYQSAIRRKPALPDYEIS